MIKLHKPAQTTTSRLFLVIGSLIIFSLACNLPMVAQSSQGADETAQIEISVRETLIAIEGADGSNGDGQSGQDSDPVPPSETPEPVISDTPTLTPTVTDTPTPEVAMIYASANTNCRTGQGTYFSWLVTLQGGDESEAVGRDTSGDYWYIRRPDNPSQFCWLWGKYATPSGPWQSLPVYTPVPTPTPGFEYKVTYKQMIGPCPKYALVFQIDNTGAFTLQSWKTKATDHTGGSNPVDTEADVFVDFPGCMWAGTQVDLTPGEGYYVIQVFDNNPDDHDITTTIKVCTEDGLAGDCLKKEIRMTP